MLSIQLPVLVIGCYGLVNLGLVIYKVVHFKTYPKEYESLLEVMLSCVVSKNLVLTPDGIG